MKRVLFSCAMLFVGFAAVAQNAPLGRGVGGTSVGAAPYTALPDVIVPSVQPTVNVDKEGPSQYVISYVDYNLNGVAENDITGGRIVFNTNAAPQDSIPVLIGSGYRPYIGFTNAQDITGTYMEGNPAAPGAKLRIDSVLVGLGHSKSSNIPTRIYGALTGATAGNFGAAGQQYFPNNTVFWRDSLITNTSLSPSGSAFGLNSTYTWRLAPNYVHTLGATSHICFRLTGITGAGDTLAIAILGKKQGDNFAAPEVYSAFMVQSHDLTNIGLSGGSWDIISIVTYTSQASLDQLEANGFTLHSFMPNPANEGTTIRYELKTPSNVTFVVTDMSGKQVDMIKLNGQNVGTFNYELNTSAYASGFYNVSMQVNNRVYTQKLNITR